MTYLLIFEDGNITTTTKEPDTDTLESIDAGVLEVIRFEREHETFESLCPDNTWKVI